MKDEYKSEGGENSFVLYFELMLPRLNYIVKGKGAPRIFSMLCFCPSCKAQKAFLFVWGLCQQTEPLIEVASQLSSRLNISSSTTWAGWLAMELLGGESAAAATW